MIGGYDSPCGFLSNCALVNVLDGLTILPRAESHSASSSSYEFVFAVSTSLNRGASQELASLSSFCNAPVII